MKISELKPKQPNVEVEAVVKVIGDEKNFDKDGRNLRLVSVMLEDDSGQIELTLWNDDIEKVGKGDKIRIKDGYVKEFRGEKQLTTGRMGELEVIEKGGSDSGDSNGDVSGGDSKGDSGEGSGDSSEGDGEDDSDKVEPEIEKI